MPVVSGRVVDVAGNPLQGVLVSLDSFWTTTNPSGRYSLEVPIGDYVFKATMRGYRTETAEVTVTEDTTINVTMRRG